jgi:very-short-patch-repair endonuclease
MLLREAHLMKGKVLDKKYLMTKLFEREFPELLPQLVEEYKFHKSRRFRFDHALPDIWLAIETEGGQYSKFGGRHNRDRDRFKYNLAASMGWTILRVSPQVLTDDPLEFVEILAAAIEVCTRRTAALAAYDAQRAQEGL